MSTRSDHSEPRTSKERKETGGGLRIADVLAGGLASAVAAIVGGTLGAVGSVVSAFVVSIVSGLVLPLLRRPLRTGEEKLRGLGGHGRQSSTTTPVAGETPSWTGSETATSGSGQPSGSRSHRRKKIWILIGSAALSLILGFGAIFLTQTLTGTQLSNGTGTLQQGVTGTHPTADTTPTQAPASQTPTTPPQQEQTSPAPSASPSATSDGTDTQDGSTTTTPTPNSEGNTGSGDTGTSDSRSGETGSNPFTPAQ